MCRRGGWRQCVALPSTIPDNPNYDQTVSQDHLQMTQEEREVEQEQKNDSTDVLFIYTSSLAFSSSHHSEPRKKKKKKKRASMACIFLSLQMSCVGA